MIWLLTILLPLLAALLSGFSGMGKRFSGALFVLASMPALWLGIEEVSGISVQWLFLESHFSLDTPRKILLLLTAILWATAGLFAGSYLKSDDRKGEFSFYFGAAMAGNFGLLISADVASFYSFFVLMTFASYGLVIHNRTPFARRAAKIYLVMAIFGELFLISCLYLAVDSAGSMLLADLPPALAQASNGRFIFALGLIGFGVKVGAIPLYFWLPLAHPAAPAPASAVLSGAMIKAGLVGWMHLAPMGLVEWTSFSLLIVLLGFTAALGAAIIGLSQVDPKTNLAYSSISQMGLMTVFFGLGLNGAISPSLLYPALALFAFNHGTTKALLFLGTVFPAKLRGPWRMIMWIGLVIGVLAIAGAPLSAGLWTKYLLKSFLSESGLSGIQTFLLLMSISAVTTTLLLSRFMHLLYQIKSPEKSKVPAYILPWVILLLAGGWWTMSSLLLPDELLFHVTGEKGLWAVFLNPQTNLSALYPVLIGLAMMGLTLRFAKWNIWPTKKPLIPPGDFLMIILKIGDLIEKLLQRVIAKLETFGQSRHSFEKVFNTFLDDKRTIRISTAAESLLRRWDIVGISFFLFFLTLFYLLR